jgi:KDO2-lipid IV(A) lauroyltransferase
MRRKGRTVVPAIADLSAALAVRAAAALFRRLPREKALGLAIGSARRLGPLLPRSRIGRDNLRLAFPDKSEAEREEILTNMWGNFARSLIEYMHVDATFDYDPDNPDAGRVTVAGVENFVRLREGGPAIVFTGHLSNWELLGVCAAKFGLDVKSLFRAPTNRHLAKRLFRARSRRMGPLLASRPGAALELAATLEAGGVIGLLVDQRFHGGILTPFFGRLADTNPLLAKLARQYECPVHGARAVRLPDGRYRLEMTDAIDLPRNGSGDIDIEKATATIQSIVEGWVREYPDQWMWVHRRWRYGRKTKPRPSAAGPAITQTD